MELIHLWELEANIYIYASYVNYINIRYQTSHLIAFHIQLNLGIK